MPIARPLLFFGIGLLAVVATVEGAPEVEWISRYDGSARANDTAYAIAPDGQGGAYVAGFTTTSQRSDDYITLHYDSTGATVWSRWYDGVGGFDHARAIAVGPGGHVYVTGASVGQNSSWDYATVKYGSGGEQLWARRYNGADNHGDQARAIAVDAAGNAYVTGLSGFDGSAEDFVTIKYSSAGDVHWVARYSGSGNGTDSPNGIALDAAGNVYVTGRSAGALTSSDFVTVKYDGSGAEQWVRRYDLQAGYDEAVGIVLDGDGNAYVGGYVWAGAQNYNFATIRYAPNGTREWVSFYNGPTNGADIAAAIGLGGAGQPVITGRSGGAPSDDFATIAYSADGGERWVARFNDPEFNGHDWPSCLAVDFRGDVYVGGKSYGGAAYFDFATVKYSAATGAREWFERYSGPVPGSRDNVWSIAVDRLGNVLVAGYSDGTVANPDCLAICYGQALPPAIVTQPQAQTGCEQGRIVLTAVAAGSPPLSYQWRRGGEDLRDEDRLTGANTPTLVIDPAKVTDDGLYSVAVSNPYGSVSSNQVHVGVVSPCDANCDGSINQFDIPRFVESMLSGEGCSSCAGDIDVDGSSNQFDLQYFIACLGG